MGVPQGTLRCKNFRQTAWFCKTNCHGGAAGHIVLQELQANREVLQAKLQLRALQGTLRCKNFRQTTRFCKPNCHGERCRAHCIAKASGEPRVFASQTATEGAARLIVLQKLRANRKVLQAKLQQRALQGRLRCKKRKIIQGYTGGNAARIQSRNSSHRICYGLLALALTLTLTLTLTSTSTSTSASTSALALAPALLPTACRRWDTQKRRRGRAKGKREPSVG